ncbi:16S rRNA (cytosine(967)-C(5))-methyltransferase RsmB [Denitratisoma oestradiolicum]|uniref:16S rRNA (cytosine(967)-C(5))-methyltransferase n=1 Tax=Denitratisoma oestradiolicum TaxID=311182 RepID=A0A6S6YTD4_9PROT|nr:16S rRNA (cytosine(967)-C(5))-methyltransferase RsmB [Denitratisoma oestradiolicum]TWO81816.1 16S rRNA (cytosine(967)-C(5))-methyltransferase [Denitratisoma oestradiolicum]CAB1370782.1 Ribosomal RNA small subunit methyltransferase B [Denitratisoma oestradiolicum]
MLPTPPVLPADSLALALLRAADAIAAVIGGRNLDQALADTPPALRPAVQDMAYGALRRHGRGDFFLARLLDKPLKESRVRALLLAALYRIEARPEDVHTTVNQAVSAAALLAQGRCKGLVNGVLRNFMRRREELNQAADGDDVARWQHPRWWITALRSAHPRDWQEVLTAGNGHPPMTLRVNRRRGDGAAYLARLRDADIEARLLDDWAIQLNRPQPVDRLPGFFEGDVSVQDWGAQRAAPLLNVQPGMRVLDACAAPGGKTAHLLELADLDLLALDADAGRAARIDDNLKRLGLAARVRAADCRAVDQWWDGRPFERILADVPCSAAGVVRRHPDIKWLRRRADVAGFAAIQGQILDALWRVLAPGGRMLYCTCSVFEEENAAQMRAFTDRHADAIRLPTAGNQTELQLLPNAEHDGFYYALLGKAA